MLTTVSKNLPSIAAAHLRSPAAFPAISVAASKVASALASRPLGLQSRTKSAVSTASAVHDETSMFDSFYLHEAKSSAGLLHPCGTVKPEKLFPEEAMNANQMNQMNQIGAGTNSQTQRRDHRQEKDCTHSDLTHLEDPYHEYANCPKLVSDLTSVSRLLARHNKPDVITPASHISMNRYTSPRFNIVRDDAKRTVIEVDVTSYRPEDVSAQISNGRILQIQGMAQGADGKHSDTKRFAKKFVLDNVDEKGVTATIEDGLLTIGLPKLSKGEEKVMNIPIV
eukprot:CAMPEP_0197719234 /NCGR_PEP_ID=MMETSP1434-20131217/3075_1 /TAXON_ID=265543 /ORGANISM="Minutocellus polymorphus, Strain CCMP3303" /LENGTH=280 /DNA_ID=CAMNT_0043303961 /DNA_START=1 /DNA_END=843 /DNA_ORIENTATION=-